MKPYTPVRKSNLPLVKENTRQAKQYLAKGDITPEELEMFIEIDPSPTRKYVGWMAKQWIDNTVDNKDRLRNTIEEFDVFLEKGKARTKDINQFETFLDLEKEVEHLNQSGAGVSVRDLESDYDTVVDTEDLLVMVPHTHEASRKLGLSQFAFRDCNDGKDSSWCTTFKAPDHFNSYYYSNNVTFYYIRIKSQKLVKQLEEAFPSKWKSLVVTALAVLDDGQIDGYDGLDNQMSKSEISKFISISGIA